MSYRNLEVWQLARRAAVEVHQMAMRDLPKFELYEEGSQIRRSAKSIRSNIVEGYTRRRYKAEWVRFLVYAHGSCEETLDHLENLWECGSLTNEPIYKQLHVLLDTLGAQLNSFLQAVERQHQSEK